MTITLRLAEFAALQPASSIPDVVRERALFLAKDLIGSIIRAAAEGETTPAVLSTIERLGLSADGNCTVFGLSRRYPPAAAALLNGVLGHSLRF